MRPQDTPVSSAFTAAELARRRAASRRMAWVIGIGALLIYAGGFFLQR